MPQRFIRACSALAVRWYAGKVNCFFFSSRRRHTICLSDWSSDVCSSDLGGTLKVVAWEGYTENQWVKPFEKQTGCTVQHQYAVSSDEMYNLMKKNAGYDLVSASGDAANRLIASGLVQAIDPKTIPDWNQLTPQLVKGPNQFVGGKHYGVPWQWGPNVL